IALEPHKRQMLLDRQKRLSRQGHTILEDWVRAQQGRFSVNPATATSIAFVKYHFDVGSVDLANYIRTRASVLVAPGAYLGAEHHLRISVGYEAQHLQAALARIAQATAELAVSRAKAG